MFSKHLLYLTGDQLFAYRWHGGELAGGDMFSLDRAGVDAFLDYIDGHAAMPAYLLADVIEEDFQRVHAPHVGGRAGSKLLQRRLLQQYRETPYRHVQVQGRETEGRRDDIVLLSALTNPAAVQPWVAALEQLQIPLAGLYSTTLLSTELVRKLALRDEHLLLVTQQSTGWRQSYFHQGLLKFSRLTLAIDRDGNPVDIGAEAAKTQQFLTSVRLIGRGSVLQVAVVAPEDSHALLEQQCEDGTETAFQFIALEHAQNRVGLKTGDDAVVELSSRLADPMLLGLLARQAPAARYELGAMRRYFQLWRIRVALYLGSAALAAASVAWVGVNLWQTYHAGADSARLDAETAQYTQRYRAAMAAMPPRVTSTANMRAVVGVERMLATQAPSPLGMMQALSEALELSPAVQLQKLDWKVSVGDDAAVPVQGDLQVTPISSLMLGIPAKPPQALLLEANIIADENDYRTVVDVMNRFAQQLARNPRITVTIERPPLDTRSSVKLSGKAGPGGVENRAGFALNLTWKP